MNRSALDIVTASAARAPALLTILGARPHLLQRVVERDFSLPPPERRLLLREVRSVQADSADEARIQHLTALVDRIRVQVAVATLRFSLTALDAARAIADLCDAVIIGLGVPVVAIGRYGAREEEQLNGSDVVLLVGEERDNRAAERAHRGAFSRDHRWILAERFAAFGVATRLERTAA